MIDITTVTPTVIFAGLIGAICWNMITWYFGIPSSSSHALIGGYAGAAIAHAGFGVLILGGWTKTLIFIALAPIIGIILGYVFKVIVSWLIRKQSLASVNKWSKVTQLFPRRPTVWVTAAMMPRRQWDYHQFTGSRRVISTFKIPLWVVLAAHTAIAIGTMSGGWRIIKTMGQKITRLARLTVSAPRPRRPPVFFLPRR